MTDRTRPTRHAAMAALVGSIAAAVAGCASSPTEGYSDASLYPDNVRNVAVDIFENDTFERGVEFELADALIKEIESRTPLKVVPSSRADSILTGRIRRVRRDVLSRSPRTGLSEEVLYIVTIDYTWRDLRTDELLLERQSFDGSGLFVPSRPTGEPIELGEFAAVQQLARGIVWTMQADW